MSNELQRVSVAITVHNRNPTTEKCLQHLFTQVGIDQNFTVEVHLVDAASNDGTSAMVSDRFPDVDLIAGDAGIFWGTGTVIACQRTSPAADFQLWLNDDVCLEPRAMLNLLSCAMRHGNSIIVGQLLGSSGAATYGGMRKGRWPLQLLPIGICADDTRCDTFNGNVVLIPRSVASQLKAIDPRFPHTMGDVDYGLRATRLEIPIFQAASSVGICDRNRPVTLDGPLHRLNYARSKKKFPVRSWIKFCFRHGGALAPVYAVSPYYRALINR